MGCFLWGLLCFTIVRDACEQGVCWNSRFLWWCRAESGCALPHHQRGHEPVAWVIHPLFRWRQEQDGMDFAATTVKLPDGRAAQECAGSVRGEGPRAMGGGKCRRPSSAGRSRGQVSTVGFLWGSPHESRGRFQGQSCTDPIFIYIYIHRERQRVL